MIGWFEQDAKPAFADKSVPEKWKDHVVQDFKHFSKSTKRQKQLIKYIQIASYMCICTIICS